MSWGAHRSLLQSRHRISSLSGMKPFPTSEVLQRAQLKQLWCQWRSSKETYLPPPKPVRGTEGKVRVPGENGMSFLNRQSLGLLISMCFYTWDW